MNAFARYWKSKEFLRFVVIGVWNTLFAYLAFAILYLALQARVHYLIIGVAAHCAAVTNAYFWQRRVVFRSKTSAIPSFARFLLVQTGALVWGVVGLFACVDLLHLHPMVSQLLLMIATVVATYSINRRFTFKESH